MIMKRNLIIAVMMTIVVSANAMTNREARVLARMMTDKMAYELRLTDRQYHEVYHINLKYADRPVAKNRRMAMVLTAHQYDKYMRMQRTHLNRPHHPSRRVASHHPVHATWHKASYKRW